MTRGLFTKHDSHTHNIVYPPDEYLITKNHPCFKSESLVPVGDPQVGFVEAPPGCSVVDGEVLLHQDTLAGQPGHGGGVRHQHQVEGLWDPVITSFLS